MAEMPVIKEEDLEEVFERSSGPGGQNVNKTSTKVTLLHKPSGVSVTVQDTRSQLQNRKLARERITQVIYQAQRAAEAAARAAKEKERRRNSPRPKKVKRAFVESKRRGAVKRSARRVSGDD